MRLQPCAAALGPVDDLRRRAVVTAIRGVMIPQFKAEFRAQLAAVLALLNGAPHSGVPGHDRAGQRIAHRAGAVVKLHSAACPLQGSVARLSSDLASPALPRNFGFSRKIIHSQFSADIAHIYLR